MTLAEIKKRHEKWPKEYSLTDMANDRAQLIAWLERALLFVKVCESLGYVKIENHGISAVPRDLLREIGPLDPSRRLI